MRTMPFSSLFFRWYTSSCLFIVPTSYIMMFHLYSTYTTQLNFQHQNISEAFFQRCAQKRPKLLLCIKWKFTLFVLRLEIIQKKKKEKLKGRWNAFGIAWHDEACRILFYQNTAYKKKNIENYKNCQRFQSSLSLVSPVVMETCTWQWCASKFCRKKRKNNFFWYSTTVTNVVGRDWAP